MRVLAIDDHTEVLDLLRRALAHDGHHVSTASSVEEARLRLTRDGADLILLDLGLPDGSGEEFCRELRRLGNEAPILVLSATSAVASRVACLDAGADDYLSKPFAVAELRARVRALSRRGDATRTLVYQRADLVLDFAARRGCRAGQEVPITSREWSILEHLLRRRGHVVQRDDLLLGVWGDATEAASASLDVLIGRIRRKLGAELIRTVRGQGYALEEPTR